MARRSTAGTKGSAQSPQSAACSALVRVLGEPLSAGLGEIDVADGVDPEPVARGRVEARQHLAAPVEDADRWSQLAHVGDLPRVEVDVRRAMDVPPLRDELALGGEHLDAAILPVANVDVPVG